ncbi:MAG: hypothetical protein QME05_00385 [Candidatus Margulisbacteria bacterium]|nr:hypothetical protein [Candidatus Margulisiibacteriota bacterium]
MKFNFRMSMFILALLGSLAALHLFVYTQNMHLKYVLTDLKLKLNELNSKNCALEGAVAAKENLADIENKAKNQLGMVELEKINYIRPGQANSVKASGEANP